MSVLYDVLQGRPVLIRDVARRDQAAPVRQRNVNALIDEGRHLGQQLGGFPGRHGERTQVARRDLLRELRDTGDPGIDLSAQQQGDCFAAARVRDVVQRVRNLRGRQAAFEQQQPGEDVVDPASGAAGHRHVRAAIDPRVDEVADVLVRTVGGDDEHEGLLRQPRDRRHVFDAVFGRIRLDGADHHASRDHERVRIRLGGERRQPDRPAGTADVGHGSGRHDPLIIRGLREAPRRLVPAATGVRWRDDSEAVDRTVASPSASAARAGRHQRSRRGDGSECEDASSSCGVLCHGLLLESFVPWDHSRERCRAYGAVAAATRFRSRPTTFGHCGPAPRTDGGSHNIR